MSAARPKSQPSPRLADLAFGLLAPSATDDSAEGRWLSDRASRATATGVSPEQLLALWRETPPATERRLAALAHTLNLSLAEILALALVVATETDLMAARVLAWLQAPVGGGRPTAGLIAELAARCNEPRGLADLAAGHGRSSGLVCLDGDERPLPETALTVPQPIVFALCEPPRLFWPGLTIGNLTPVALPPSICEAAQARAAVLYRSGASAFAIRSGHALEARAVAAEMCARLGATPVFLEGAPPAGLGPWLWLAGAVPVFCLELAPGERHRVNEIPGWYGPILVVTGPDGMLEFRGEAIRGWQVSAPAAQERAALWQTAVGDAALSTELGVRHRHAAGRIAEIGRAARFEAQLAGQAVVTVDHVQRAARSGLAGGLGSLAELMPDTIPDEALILTPALSDEMQALAARCVARDTLSDGLGPALRARFRPGVRALLVGPSGTGKTLAVSWLATRLGLPLYRVDLASVTSKYIGETEKNLSQLFARAEHAEVVLMFDEADALFGKRTDVKDSNDRFANAQTNYLLSRIESYEGIAVLTTNSRARFDSAFTRRLDMIIEFPAPGPDERRALWRAHLGDRHTLDTTALNRLAAGCELAGGHIRNVVLAAASQARSDHRPIAWEDVLVGLAAEYRKLGKPVAPALGAGARP